jgi:hypothetical protein
MRDNITRSKTTYSSRNAGGGEPTEEARVSRPRRFQAEVGDEYEGEASVKPEGANGRVAGVTC